MQDQFSRTRRLMGPQAVTLLAQSRVAVFGVGGVGGYAAEALARSGVGTLDLFDKDTVSLTNLNRQIIALHSTLGMPKAQVMAERIHDINPDCRVTAQQIFYLPQNADEIDLTQYDYVVDCIDNVTAKLELITRCTRLGVPIISSMGAANKLDPTAFRVADISKTQVCPLAKVIRLECRRRKIKKLKVVYSTEQPIKPLPPQEGEENSPASAAFVPGAAGLAVAGEVDVNNVALFCRLGHHQKSMHDGRLGGLLIDQRPDMPLVKTGPAEHLRD